MAILVVGTITISKGWKTWRDMVFGGKEMMTAMGVSIVFAGTQKDDATKLHVVMRFEAMDGFKKFRSDEALTQRRKDAGAMIETGVHTVISDDYFTNFPVAM